MLPQMTTELMGTSILVSCKQYKLSSRKIRDDISPSLNLLIISTFLLSQLSSSFIQMVSLKHKTLFLVYPCHVCENHRPGYQKAGGCIAHLREHHGYVFPSRAVGIKRPKNRGYFYQTDSKKEYDEQQFACPSCWYHTDDLELFTKHMHDHDPGVTVPLRKSGAKPTSDFVYNGKYFDKPAVQSIFQKITDITELFKDILTLKG
ncbi:hypothetical protein MBANPS3_000823 [Mucor bainieri]